MNLDEFLRENDLDGEEEGKKSDGRRAENAVLEQLMKTPEVQAVTRDTIREHIKGRIRKRNQIPKVGEKKSQ